MIEQGRFRGGQIVLPSVKIGTNCTLFSFYKRHVYKRLSLDFWPKLRTNLEQPQAEFQVTLISKKILEEFLSISTKFLKIMI